MDWKALGEALHLGGRTRVHCDCAPHRTISRLVSKNEDGSISSWCFRCKEPGYVPPPHMSLAERLEQAKRKRLVDAEYRHSINLPEPIEPDPEAWPLHARVWLYKAGLSDDEIQGLGFYYHPPTDRVVLPVLDSRNDLIFWQARGFDEHTPKYINPRVDRKHIVYKTRGPDTRVCLTEDILSAVRVSKAGCMAWAIMGTDLTDEILASLIHQECEVVVFMDPDGPGQDAARKICHRLNVFGLVHANIVASKDPKLLSLEDIRELIDNAEYWEG